MPNCSQIVKVSFHNNFINGFIEVVVASKSFSRNVCKKKGNWNPFGRGKLEGT